MCDFMLQVVKELLKHALLVVLMLVLSTLNSNACTMSEWVHQH